MIGKEEIERWFTYQQRFSDMTPEQRLDFWERFEDLGDAAERYEKARDELIDAARDLLGAETIGKTPGLFAYATMSSGQLSALNRFKAAVTAFDAAEKG